MPASSRLGAASLLAFLLSGSARADQPQAASVPTFERHIRPILKAHCFECHGEGKKLRGGLDVRLQRLLVAGGDSGPAVVAGKRDDSLLYRRVRAHEMPPGKTKLSGEEIERIGRWLDGGARVAAVEPKSLAPGLHITDEERAFWAFQPITRPAVPAVKHTDRVRNPTDAFLLARLEEKGLTFAWEADRHTLIRRASLDLLGLPPTPGLASLRRALGPALARRRRLRRLGRLQR
jgi:mono/diheme cytochrome c family protein